MRERTSTFQIANIGASLMDIHVQIFNVTGQAVECEELEFDDQLSPNDVHTYDFSNLISNSDADSLSGESVPPNDLSNGYGFIVVSRISGPTNSILGVIRVKDNDGYDYRANAAGEESGFDFAFDNVVSFGGANGNTFSELIGITYVDLGSNTVYASSGVATIFGNMSADILIYNENENDTVCSPASFSCSNGNLNIGIDNSVPQTKGNTNRACNTNMLGSNSAAFLSMPFDSFECTDPLVDDGSNGCINSAFFVGFIGLNNGNGSGSFDSWTAKQPLVN